MCDENGSWVVNLTLCGSQYSVHYTVCSNYSLPYNVCSKYSIHYTVCSNYSVPYSYTLCSKCSVYYTALFLYQIVQKFAFKRGEEENEDVDDTIDFETMR